jgi:lipopolysaccharide/colanic/teichoic acid biosynthesis glycosyltransferase
MRKWTISVNKPCVMPNRFYLTYGKRLFDIAASMIGLVLLSPVLFVAAVLVKISDGGPVLFRQTRMGRDFRPFQLLKFRTMIVDADHAGPPVTADGDPRITPIGRALRKTKLDELPQLVNVFKGDMSIVGPRPEVPKYVEMFRNGHYNAILQVRPGITDYAAIAFRDEESVLGTFDSPEEGYVQEVLPRKIELYEQYLREIRFATDIKLVLLTLWRIVRP